MNHTIASERIPRGVEVTFSGLERETHATLSLTVIYIAGPGECREQLRLVNRCFLFAFSHFYVRWHVFNFLYCYSLNASHAFA